MIEIPHGFTREQLLACLEREIRLRELKYPEWVAMGRMRASTATDQILMMKAVRGLVAQLPPPPQVQGRLFDKQTKEVR